MAHPVHPSGLAVGEAHARFFPVYRIAELRNFQVHNTPTSELARERSLVILLIHHEKMKWGVRYLRVG